MIDICYYVAEANSMFLKPAVKPTHEPFGLDSKLFALFRPSLLLASETADETGRCLHLVSAALSILQQCLMGKGPTNRSVGWCVYLALCVCPSVSASIQVLFHHLHIRGLNP